MDIWRVWAIDDLAKGNPNPPCTPHFSRRKTSSSILNLQPSTINITMTNLLTIPNELLDEIASYLDALDTSHLVLSCRFLAFVLTPAMHLHAEAPQLDEPALHWASRRGHLPLVQHLLTRFPVDLEQVHPIWSQDPATPLHAACMYSRSLPTIELLLQHGAAINHVNHSGLTALYYACWSTTEDLPIREDIIRLLLARGAHPNGQAYPPLGIAVSCGFSRRVRLLLDAGASTEVIDITGEPVIVKAARHWMPEDVRILVMLLDHGADPNAANAHGSTALLLASQYGPIETVRLLVARGVDLRCQDRDGDTPLLVALRSRQKAIAEYLVGLDGMDLHSANIFGHLPWSQALSMEYDDVVEALESRGVVIQRT